MVNLFSRTLLRLVVSLSLSFLILQAAPVGAVKGYVKDASGASIRDASLVLRDQKTGVQTESHSDANGLYQFLNLNPSVYSLSVTASGFSGREAKDITVLVGQIVSLDAAFRSASTGWTPGRKNSHFSRSTSTRNMGPATARLPIFSERVRRTRLRSLPRGNALLPVTPAFGKTKEGRLTCHEFLTRS